MWRRTSSTSIRAASSTGKPPTPVPKATSPSDRAPSSSALASVLAVAARMISAEVGPPSHRRGVDHPARRHRAGARRHRLAEADRGQRVARPLNHPPARPGDGRRDAAAVRQRGVGGVGDRVDLERRDVRLADLDLGHRSEPNSIAGPAASAARRGRDGARPGRAGLWSTWALPTATSRPWPSSFVAGSPNSGALRRSPGGRRRSRGRGHRAGRPPRGGPIGVATGPGPRADPPGHGRARAARGADDRLGRRGGDGQRARGGLRGTRGPDRAGRSPI